MTSSHNSVIVPKNPFLGLRPFTEDQGDLLYERDGDMELVISRLAAGPLTVLFATSGVGKTSFIRAKLLRELRERFGEDNVSAPPDWQRRRPIEGLKEIRQKIAMSGKLDETHVVVLDQFEEIFQYFASLERLNVISESSVERLDTFGEELAYLLNGSLADLPLRAVLAEDQVRAGTTFFAEPEKDVITNSDAQDSDAEAYFAQLKSRLDIRILISVREEFLADLSLFDSYLPGLFSNYYRLHKPTLEQARAIISQTIAPTKTSVHIEQLLSDLKAVNRRDPRHENAVDPPYLQIVCKRLWDRQRPSEESEFLANYREGQAQEELDKYCREILNALPRKERVILCKVLGQLTGPKEAKKAVRVSDLTHEIRIHDRECLLSLLEKLSAAGIVRKPLPRETEMDLPGRKRTFQASLFSRALQWFIPKRYSDKLERASGDPVFELYHDMYAPLLWAWKTEQENKERLRTNFIVVTAVVLLGLTVGNPFWEWSKRSQLLAKPPDALSQVGDLREVRNAFAHSLVWMWLGNHLWRENCRRYSSYLALRGDTDGAIWYKAASSRTDNTHLEPRDIAQALGPARYLRNTAHSESLGGTFTDVILTGNDTDAEVKYIATTSNGKIIRYPDPIPIDIRQSDESIPSNATVKVLCLSPTGKRAVVAYVDRAILFVGLVSTTDGKLHAKADFARIQIVTVPDHAPKPFAKNTKTTVQRQPTEPHSDPYSSDLLLNDVRASFSSDENVFGILLNGKVMIRSVPTGSSLEISPVDLRVEDFSFSPHNPDLLALSISREKEAQHLPAYSVSIPGLILNDLIFWKRKEADIQRSTGKLPPHARPVFGNGEAVLAIDKDANNLHTAALNPVLTQEHSWAWFSMSENVQGAHIVLPGGVIPQAIDPNRYILLSTDSVGRLIFSAISSATAKSLVLSVSEQRGTILESRNTTAVSVNDFSQNKLFASIDGNGSALRIWSVPDLEDLHQSPPSITNDFQVLDQPPPIATTNLQGFGHSSPSSKDPIWFSLNNNWQAKWIHNHLEITTKGGDLSMKNSWSLSLPTCPSNVRISGDGSRVVIFNGPVFSYSSRDWANSKRELVKLDKAPSTTRYVAFGPGENRVALASDEELLIYGPEFGNGSLISSEWSAKIKGPSSLVEGNKAEGSKEDEVIILTTTSWIHRISYSDSATSRFHHLLEGRKRSEPDISSMMRIAPIDTYYPKFFSVNLHPEVNANEIIQKSSKTQAPSPDAKPSAYDKVKHLSSFVWTIDLCSGPSPHQAASDLVCEWETRSGLHGSD
jgi:hypothetical protein